MVSFGVIVSEVFANRRPQRVFAEEDHSFQAFFLDRPYESLRIRVQVWTTRRNLRRLDSGFREDAKELCRVEWVSVMDQVALPFQDSVFAVGDVSAELLHPESVRTLCYTSQLHSPRREFDEKSTMKR